MQNNISSASTTPTKKPPVPLVSSKISAGFPSPAEGYFEKTLDLHDHIVKNPASTFFVKVEGSSMEDAGIFEGDMLVVDKSLPAFHGKIVIAAINGELTVKRLKKIDGKVYLVAENKSFKPIELHEENDNILWGVVTHVIRGV